MFFTRNVIAAKKIAKIKFEKDDALLFRGYYSSDEKEISEVYKKLNGGVIFSQLKRILYRHIGHSFMLVVEERGQFGQSKIVGMNMYYLNKRDIQENTIHEAFIGVLPDMGRRGIATKMRKVAISHFKSVGFSGISTRISLNNDASLTSAKKTGFHTVEEYQEPSTGETRHYMICRL